MIEILNMWYQKGVSFMREDENDIKEIGKRIRRLRKERGLTVAELAEKVDITEGYLGNIERGAVENPTLKVLTKIAQSLNLKRENLLSETKSETKRTSFSYGHPKTPDDFINETKSTQRKYKRAMTVLDEVLTDEAIPESARRELAEEVISLVNWAKRWSTS